MAEITKEQAEAVSIVLMNSTWHVPSSQGLAAVGLMQSFIQGVTPPEAKAAPKGEAPAKKRESLKKPAPPKKRTPKRSRKGKAK